MTTKRKPYLLEPGDGLLVSTDIQALVGRWTTFKADSGLADDQVTDTTIISLPLPKYSSDGSGSIRDFKGVNPRFLWHPFCWLPPRLTEREVWETQTGTVVEPDDYWAVRVALELVASGLYDPASGTWVDILSLAGLDLTKETDLNRAQAWLAGGDDPDLDAIDLTGLLSGDGEAATDEAYLQTPTVLAITTTNLGVDLANLADSLQKEADEVDDKTLKDATIALVGYLVVGLLDTHPEAECNEEMVQMLGFFTSKDAVIGRDECVAAAKRVEELSSQCADASRPLANEFFAQLPEDNKEVLAIEQT